MKLYAKYKNTNISLFSGTSEMPKTCKNSNVWVLAHRSLGILNLTSTRIEVQEFPQFHIVNGARKFIQTKGKVKVENDEENLRFCG